MKWRLKQLQAEYQMLTGERMTYEKITAATGLSPSTLSEMSTGRMKRADLETINRLLTLFGVSLSRQLTTGDLLEYTPDA